MALAPNQQIQYDQLKSAGASHDSAFNAAILVQPQTTTTPTTGGLTTGGFTTSFGATNPQQPITQVQAPTTQPPTPSAPVAQPITQQPTQQQGQQPPAMPAAGSVIDLLNMAGVDSSQANRQKLAQQYGIQGYDFSASKNQELAKKFLEAFNANKSTPTPQSGAEASSALDSYFQDNQLSQEQDPTKSFMDAFGSMNPIEANIYSQISNLLSTTTNQQSLTDFYKQEVAAQGIPELNMELADINRIMEGTEDDIRDEISNAGGFVTESQVQALTGARNKNLLKKANYLTNVLSAKNDYVDRIVSLTQADRKQVSEDLDRKLGIATTLFDMSQQMTRNAKENYKMIVDSVGWEGLAKSLGGDKKQIASVEKLFGMAPGELAALAAYKKPLTEMEQLNLENQRLQNQKLRGDIADGGASKLQFISGTANQPSGVFNPATGVFTPSTPGADGPSELKKAYTQQKVQEIDNIINDDALKNAVGTSWFGRSSPFEIFSGAKSTFIGNVQTLIKGMTINELLNAKESGATFGALSDTELGLLAAAATQLSSPAWTVTDDAGNIIGWKVPEETFKKELDTISYFTKLDYVLKGGDPASIGAIEAPDGSLLVENSDGTFSKLK